MFGFIIRFSMIIVVCVVSLIFDSKNVQAQSHQCASFPYHSQILSHQSQLFTENRTLRLKETDMPSFPVLTNKNSKGLRNIYGSFVSELVNENKTLSLT